MRLYVDDDSVDQRLLTLLRQAGHDLAIPADVGLAGENDSVHLRQSIRDRRALLTHNFDDFRELHELVIEATGHHFGVLVIRKDDDPKRDMKRWEIVRAVDNLLAASVPIADQYIILNHWR
jgi:hypothetical protein